MFLMTISRNYVRVTFLSFICTSSSLPSFATISPLNWLAENKQKPGARRLGRPFLEIWGEQPWPPSILMRMTLFPWWDTTGQILQDTGLGSYQTGSLYRDVYSMMSCWYTTPSNLENPSNNHLSTRLIMMKNENIKNKHHFYISIVLRRANIFQIFDCKLSRGKSNQY